MANNNYTWNSNQTKSRQANMFLAMNDYTLNAANATNYHNAASGFVHYMHGVNPNTKVYLSNMKKYGAENYVKQFYHAWFHHGSALWDEVGVSTYGPAPGYIPGGPNPSYAKDACCAGSCSTQPGCALNVTPPMGQPIQKSYKDFNDSWPVNSWEITEAGIYTNAAYVRMLSKFCSTGCVTSTGISNLKENGSTNLKLYPNPTSGILNVELEILNADTKIQIINSLGEVLLSESVNIDHPKFNIQHFLPGIYFVELNNSNGRQVAKFIKE
jgi:hypothetical protein